MNNEEIEGRLQGLEIGMQSVVLRLEAMEARLSQTSAQPTVVVPPPVIDLQPRPQPVTQPVQPKVMPAETIAPSAAPSWPNSSTPPHVPNAGLDNLSAFSTQRPASDPDAMEYKVGINGLLRGGAVVIVCAVLFLVALALGRGWITPTNQFVGEILLCLGFVALGIWKHEEREDFGQLMVGIGSFGLYASFAGAYAFKHLYEGETLVVLYMLLSMANLAFSHWRASKSFLTIGLIGGLVAAVMPMHRDKVMLDFALHFAILVPCALIIIKNKWNGMAALMWTVSTIALLPATTSNFLQAYRVGATYLNCAIALYACGKVFKPSEFDKHAAIQTAMLILTGFFAIGIDVGHKGSLHALFLTAIAAAIGYAIRENEKARNATWLGGLVVFTIITPIGYTQDVAAFWYAVEALILAGLGLRFGLVALPSVGFGAFLFSMGAYLYYPDKQTFSLARFHSSSEMLFLAISSTTAVLNLRFVMAQKNKEVADVSLFFGGSLLTAFFIRGVNICLGNGMTHLSAEDITALGFGVASVVGLLLSARFNRAGLYIVAIIQALISCTVALAYDPLEHPLWLSFALVIMASGTVIIGARLAERANDKSYAEPTLVFTGLILSALFLRIFGVAGGTHLLGLTADSVVPAGLVILNLAWTGFAIWRRRPAHFILGWTSMAVTAISGLDFMTVNKPEWLCPVALIVPAATLVALYCITPRAENQEAGVSTLFVLGEWILMTNFLRQELMRPWIGMHGVAALSVSWVIIAVSLIACGFQFQRRYLRYWSLGIFMVTVGKVFLIDLSELDSVIRVLMLMLLGIGMVGGGYWYIRWGRGKTIDEPKSP